MLPSELNCCNVECDEKSHLEAIDHVTLDISCALLECSIVNIPRSSNKSVTNRKKIHGWNTLVEPHRTQSIYWHNTWVNEGRPNQGWLYDTMCQKRKLYHKAVSSCVASEKRRKAESLLASNMKSRDIFTKELGKIKSPNVKKNFLLQSLGVLVKKILTTRTSGAYGPLVLEYGDCFFVVVFFVSLSFLSILSFLSFCLFCLFVFLFFFVFLSFLSFLSFCLFCLFVFFAF